MSGSVLSTTGLTLFRLSFEISPIVLVGGIAQLMPGGVLPIVALTESGSFLSGLLNGSITLDNLDAYFAHFVVMPGGSLIQNESADYPFANQTYAANAVVSKPLNVSLKMICPVKSAGGYTAKLATITALKATLDTHISLGGLFTVATPSYIYPDMILLGLTDMGSDDSKQAQVNYQWDFKKPLVTLNQAQTAQNSFMNKLTNGLPTDGSLTGASATTGSSFSGAASLVPASTNVAGTTIPSASAIGSSILAGLTQ